MRRSAFLLVALLPVACTFDGLDGYTSGDAASDVTRDVAAEAHPPPADAQTDSASEAAVDAAPDVSPPPCNLGAPFGTPQALTTLNTSVFDAQAALSPDQLTISFTSNRQSAGMQAFTASRATTAAAFGSVALLSSLDFANADTWNVALTGDGLTAYYVTDLGAADHLWKATRASSLASFSGNTQMPHPVVEGEQPYVLPDGSALYYTDSKITTVDVIVRAALGGSITTATQALSVGTHSAGLPVVTPDELTIYFSVYDVGNQNYDIWRATRGSASSAWGAPTVVSELNTTGFDAPSWISADDCAIYFTRGITSSNWDLYTARRPP